jgi:hypothetical protein
MEASVPSGQAQIRELLNDTAAGHHAKEAAQIVAGYAADIVMYSLAPPLRSHRGDLLDIGGSRNVDMTTAEGVQRWLDGFGAAPFDYEIRDLEAAAGGDAAADDIGVAPGARAAALAGRWPGADINGSMPAHSAPVMPERWHRPQVLSVSEAGGPL